MTTWEIDPSHSRVGFAVRHLVIAKVTGRFAKFSGQVEYDDGRLETARVRAEIDAASIDTAEAKRDAHLRSGDFFDAEKWPKLTFVSKRVEAGGKDRFRLVGDLTIRDTTREVALEVESLGRAKDPWGGERLAFEARGAIERKEFGLNWNQALETGGVLVGEKVELLLEIQAVKK